MKKKDLIAFLNRDLAEEHAAIIRYLVHGWLEGEDTPIGASLLSRSREEMWHMHWLGMIIGQLGGEPNFKPAPYPYDPTNRETIFHSYIKYEERLIPHYNREAEMVDDPHIKRVLHREAWESSVHAKKFQKILDKLNPEQARGVPGGERELPQDLLNILQKELTSKYSEMLNHIRYAWVFQKNAKKSWQLMDQSMEKMKQIAHFAEDIAENGVHPQFNPGKVDLIKSLGKALQNALEDVRKSYKRHITLSKNSDIQKHRGMVINLDLTIQQEEFQAEELHDMYKGKL